MPRHASPKPGLEVWRVAGLRNLELQRAEHREAASTVHFHDQYEIAITEGGPQRVTHRGVSHLLAPGSLLVMAPGEIHRHGVASGAAISRSFFPGRAALIDAADSRATRLDIAPVISDADLAARIAILHRLLARPGGLLACQSHAVVAATLLVQRHGSG